MKKYIFIYNTDFDIIISGKNGAAEMNTECYNYYVDLIKPYIIFKENKNLYKINYEILDNIKEIIIDKLKLLLKEREVLPPASKQSEWRGRFTEEQMINTKFIFGKEYKLFTGGIDNEIFWIYSFIELLENSKLNKIDLYVYFNEKIININRLKYLIKTFVNKK